MLKPTSRTAVLSAVALVVIAALFTQIPAVNQRLAWRLDVALTYLRGVIQPAGDLPTPLPTPVLRTTQHPTVTPADESPPANTPAPTAFAAPTATVPTPTPLPQSVLLPSPPWEKQEPNNCGPATLAMYLQSYGWDGNQSDISQLLKPLLKDRNVNVEELVYYARTRVGWLNTEYRVGGNTALLESFLAAGIPVMIEEGMILEETYWPNDDHWAGHYLLINGYDQAAQTFIAQDSFRGADQPVPYASVKKNWQAFNYVYILIYRPEQADTVKTILGDSWDADANRAGALELARSQTQADPQSAFAWFNLGTNLVYFEEYGEAARAYDTARNLGLPQRMLRYQFGPFFAYFFSGRNDDLLALTEYALQRTPNSEEALLWRGWGLYRGGKKWEAMESFRQALEANPNYQDAQYALDFVKDN